MVKARRENTLAGISRKVQASEITSPEDISAGLKAKVREIDAYASRNQAVVRKVKLFGGILNETVRKSNGSGQECQQ